MANIQIKKPGLVKEFMDFLEEYKVVGLAIAFIMGVTATALIKSLVDNIIMPTITPMIPGGAWKTATISIWQWNWGIGAFAGELLNFVVIAFVIFMVAKYIMKETKVTKK